MAPPQYPMFQDALTGGSLRHALRLAEELTPVALGDAAKLLALTANDEHGDADRFERAAIRCDSARRDSGYRSARPHRESVVPKVPRRSGRAWG